jgi:hypothetical protein
MVRVRQRRSTRLPSRAEGHLLSEETSEDAVLQDIQADDGIRTHGLLHGNPPRCVDAGPAAAWLSQMAEGR